MLESRFSHAEVAQLRQDLPILRRECQAKLQSSIEAVINLLRPLDVFEVLAWLFHRYGITDPTSYVESESEAKEFLAEYVLSVFTALPPDEEGTTSASLEALERLVQEIEIVYAEARNLVFLAPHKV